MMYRDRWWLLGAHILMALTIAATVLAFTVLQDWISPVIPGAASGFQYVALGFQRSTGDNFSSLATNQLPAILSKLPPDLELGLTFSNEFRLFPRPGKGFPVVDVGLVFGDYFQALHLHPLAGHLISLSEQEKGTPVIVLSARQARHWFGSVRSAIGRAVYDTHGLALRVVGVLPDKFTGTERLFRTRPTVAWIPGTLMLLVTNGSWPKINGHQPSGNLLKHLPIMGLAPLLSVPDNVSVPRLRAELARVFTEVKAQLPKDVQGFAVATPYSLAPMVQHKFAQRMRLFLGLALAALILAAINVLVLQWLGYLRRRGILNLERMLGARRGYLLRRMLLHGLGTLVVLLLGSALLTALGAVLARHLVSGIAPVLTVDALLAPLAWVLPSVVVLVVLAEMLPLIVLLGRERLDGSRTVSGARGDRVFGSVLLASEIALGLLMSVLAAWAILYAWQSTHQPVGFLDRPATFVTVQPTGDAFSAIAHPDQNKAQILLRQTLQVAASTGPCGAATVGVGPQIVCNADFELPRSISAGTRNASACVVSATPGWIEAGGVHLLAGVKFAAEQVQAGQILLDARLADQLFGSPTKALGHSIIEQNRKKPWHIIGVVAPVYLHANRKDDCPVVFRDLRNSVFGLYGAPHSLVIAGTMTDGQRQVLHQRLDDFFKGQHIGLKVKSVFSTGELRDWLAAQQILRSRVFTSIALVAWMISLSGIWALLRLYLAQKRRLLAIESALGATPSRVYRGLVFGTLSVAGIGAMIALLLLPWLATQFAFLSGAQVSPFGTATWVALAVLLLAVFLVAHFPARRAARAEPAQSLHEL